MEGKKRFPKLADMVRQQRDLEGYFSTAPRAEVATPEMVENMQQARMERRTIRTDTDMEKMAQDPTVQAAQRDLADKLRGELDRTMGLLMQGYHPAEEVDAARRAEQHKDMPDEWRLREVPMTVEAAVADPQGFVEGMYPVPFDTEREARAHILEAWVKRTDTEMQQVITASNPTAPAPSLVERMRKALGRLVGPWWAGRANGVMQEALRDAERQDTVAHMRAMTTDNGLRPAPDFPKLILHVGDGLPPVVEQAPEAYQQRPAPGMVLITTASTGQVVAEVPMEDVKVGSAGRFTVTAGPPVYRNRAERRAAERRK